MLRRWSCLTTKSSFQTTRTRSGLAFLCRCRAWLRFSCFLFWWRVFRLNLVTWIWDSCGLTGRLDVRQLFSRKCGSCLDLENSSSFPLFVKTFLWTRDCSPVILFHFLGSILHLKKSCPSRFKIIKRNWAFGTRYLEKLTTKCLVVTDQLSPVVVNLPVIISCIGKGLHW